jgi:hypothetical protein
MTAPVTQGNSLIAVAQVQLGVNAVYMVFNRLFFNNQRIGNFPVTLTTLDQFQNVAFPPGQQAFPLNSLRGCSGRSLKPGQEDSGSGS